MAEQVDSHTPHEHDDASAAPASRRSLRQSAASARVVPRVEKRPSGRRGVVKSVRSVVVVAMVGGMVATVALPAYAAFNPDSGSTTVEQLAADDAQSLVVDSDVSLTDLSRSSYSATTADELAQQKAQEAAAAAAAAAAASAASTSTSTTSVDLSMVAPGSGEVRWPLDMSTITIGRGLSSTHQGVDLLGAYGTYEYAAAAGTVTKAGYYGDYGNVVFIQSTINGQSVVTTYAHMSTIIATVGETVSAGQLIGLMGMTGNATANHLHFEVRINGTIVDPLAWLEQNAG
ncbi:MAG: M23 family metallopeptidase [Microbacterium sp.]|uniref:M23 family metallopeptidase n=1 Tax=Microbacterium sp. TaxID=51671 RepID=UPI0039E42C4E